METLQPWIASFIVITDPFFYLVAIPAVFIVGLSKGGFGGAIAVVGVPLMALAISPVAAAGILLPIFIVMDLFAVFAWRGRFDRQVIRHMIPAAIVGITVGYFTAAIIPPDGTRIVVGLVATGFAINWFWRSRHILEPAPRNRAKAWGWGIGAGFTSFVAHAGGPPYQVYVLPLRLDPQTYAGTAVIFFAAINGIKLIPYFLLGQFSAENLATSAALLPLAPIATLAGIWLVKRIEPTLFYKITHGLLIPVGLKLIYDGVHGIVG